MSPGAVSTHSHSRSSTESPSWKCESRHAALLEIAGKDAEAVIAADPKMTGERAKALRLARELLTPRVNAETESSS